jgi:hypothetical protein
MHIRIILGFLEKHTNGSKEAFAFSTYKMQVLFEEKKPNGLCGI